MLYSKITGNVLCSSDGDEDDIEDEDDGSKIYESDSTCVSIASGKILAATWNLILQTLVELVL